MRPSGARSGSKARRTSSRRPSPSMSETHAAQSSSARSRPRRPGPAPAAPSTRGSTSPRDPVTSGRGVRGVGEGRKPSPRRRGAARAHALGGRAVHRPVRRQTDGGCRRSRRKPPPRKGSANRNLLIAAGAAAAVVVVLVGASLLLRGGGSSATRRPAATGIGQVVAAPRGDPAGPGASSGSPKAKVTMIQFEDLQCPICRRYQEEGFPGVVDEYVRPGKVKLRFVGMAFLGPDSEKALLTRSPRASRASSGSSRTRSTRTRARRTRAGSRIPCSSRSRATSGSTRRSSRRTPTAP